MDNFGIGKTSPLDTDEFIEITVEIKDGEVIGASFKCNDDEFMKDCGQTICRMIKQHTPEDVMQITNNVVFYNTEKPLPRQKLYLGAMATLAAKRAVSDWGKRNGKDFSEFTECNCC